MQRPGRAVIGNISRRLVEVAGEWSGVEINERGTGELVESARDEARKLRRTLDFVGFRLFNFSAGQAWELRPQARRLTAQKSLVAFVEDPMAGHQVSLYLSFVFGRGVPRPIAHDAEVQKALDETAEDPSNKRILTSFEALLEKGIDFNVQSNVFFLVFDDGQDGMVRLSLLPFSIVDDVVRHPKDQFRLLYYKAIEQTYGYDYVQGRRTVAPGSTPKIVYYEALDAFNEDDPVEAVQDAGLTRAPDGMMRRGKVLHLATNKTSEMAFGVPIMRRLLRWYSAYNKVLESHVDRMAAMASIYMKATEKGAGPRELQRLAVLATNRQSRLDSPVPDGGLDDGTPPAGAFGPGMLAQNESLNFEPFKIDAGASDVAASAPHLRAQFAAGGGFANPGYFGSEGGALAGAQAIELPILKFIERDQELWAGVFRRFYKAAIDRRVELGMISEWRDMTADEQEAMAYAEENGEEPAFEVNEAGQVKRDLSFEFNLPSPLKRAMTDLVSAAVSVATAVDPTAQNPELSRWLFGFLLSEAFDVEDPQRVVDQVLPRHVAEQAAQGQVAIDPQTGEPIPTDDQGQPTSTGPDGKQHPPDKPYGGRSQSPPPEDRQVTETAHGGRRRRSSVVARRRRALDTAFDEDVVAVAKRQIEKLSGLSSNGNGSH
jgi:hypothetical protein